MAKKESKAKKNASTKGGTVFDKHAEVATSKQTTNKQQQGLGWTSKILIFIGFPTLVGILGLYLAYIESIQKPEREINFDVDFVIPFLLALSMCIVIGFQTRGYKSKQIEPLVQWPKIRKKKVIKQVVKKSGEVDAASKDAADKKDD